MSAAPLPARASPRPPARHDLALVLLLACASLVLAAMVFETRQGAGSTLASRWLALLAVLIAAYSRRGLAAALLTAAFFASSLTPALAAAWNTPAFRPLLTDLLAYGLLLGVTAYLAASVASFLRTREALSGAVRDWGALLEATVEREELAALLLRQAAAVGQARGAALLTPNPVDGQWEAFSLQGEALQRAPVAGQARKLNLAQWLIDQGRPQILDGLPDDRRFILPLTGAGQVLHSLLAQPLAGRDGSLLAMMVLLNRQTGAFGQADFAALAGLAEAAATALEQAGRYAATDHTLARRVEQLAALQRSARELNATVDPQAIVDETMACAMAISGGQVGLVSAEAPGGDVVYRAWNVQVESDTIRRATSLAHDAPHPLRIPADDDSFYSLLPRPGLRLMAPIRRTGHTFGLILVESDQPRAFGEEALRAVASLADHAAVALDNTRLFSEIVREKRKSDEVIASIADALLTVGHDGQVMAFNPAAEALTGWRAEEAAGHLVCDVLGCQRGGLCRESCHLMRALPGGQRVVEAEWTLRQRLGTQRMVALDASPLPAGDGQEGGLVVLMRDVTEAWELEQMQGELIAAFSHELRTPLSIINTATEMLLAGEGASNSISDHEAMLLATLQAQTERLTGFADRIVALARTEEQALELMPLPLAYLLEDIVAHWRGSLAGHMLRLSRPPAEVWVLADARALHGVLDALIDNATKYAPPGTPIELTIDLQLPGFATVAVCDRGPGIPVQSQARIFDRFYRADAGDAQRVYGHGLGLYLARVTVAQMGGQIWLESEAGCGSRFAFTLPLTMEGLDEDLGD